MTSYMLCRSLVRLKYPKKDINKIIWGLTTGLDPSLFFATKAKTISYNYIFLCVTMSAAPKVLMSNWSSKNVFIVSLAKWRR